MTSLNIGIYGFGSIGRLIAKEALGRGFNIIGVVDIDPSIAGKKIGEIIGVESPPITVSRDPSVLRGSDVIIHATGSYLDKVFDQLVTSIKMGADVISTCETLSYPWLKYPVLARRLDELAVKHNVSVLGTGINPGFLLDTLAIVIASSVNRVKKITAKRSLDASRRRESFRRKIGIGLTIEEALAGFKSGVLTGHVGYAESAALIADALGYQPSSIIEGQEPLLADSPVESFGVRVDAGRVKGVRGYGVAYRANGDEIARVEFEAYVGAPEYEEIIVEGRDYTVVWRSSGTPGDAGTVAVVLSLAEKIGLYGPGLLTMVDILPFRPL